ncbi:phosphatase PAP2 family protein [Rheinheimera texasensis]|jgi:membrane-associated PAP2 superfamily phosphatase|uniref:phosphatase PAP2 family protein n=1 Tax=Rheinheimera texasensis TaxID=306205 RepID=UPI0032B2A033
MYLVTINCQDMQQIHSQDLLKLVLIPTALFVIGFGIFYGAELDFVVATTIFELEGGQWRLTNHWLFSDVLHSGSRLLNNIMLANLLGYWLYQKFTGKGNIERTTALTKLVISLLLSFAVVALLKRVLPAECPWDLQQFGGDLPFIGIFSQRPATMPATQCFPAGHASVGYAWVALYFYFLPLCFRKARIGLAVGLLLGLLLGITQQLRGAHFFSHDLTTLWLCWVVSSLVYLTYPNRLNSSPKPTVEQYYV